MRIIIIKDDALVAIDGEYVEGVDLTELPEGIHAVQWYDTYGEIEFEDGSANERFENFDERFGFVHQKFAGRKLDIKRNSPPNSYSDWVEVNEEWVVNDEKKTAYDTAQQVSVYKEYLNSTDWYYTRLQETGVGVPVEVVAERIAARTYIQEHEV